MSDWVYDRWMKGYEPNMTAYWHGLRPYVLFNVAPYPWDLPPCTALVKEGPKALVPFKEGLK